MNVKKIASNANVNPKTVHGATYLEKLVEKGFVRAVDEEETGVEKGFVRAVDEEETGGPNRYVFENVNGLSRHRSAKYALAPGNVEYAEEFKNELGRLIGQTDLRTKFRILLEYVKYIVESVKESGEQKIAPNGDGSQVCSTCGLNHEARDFIRASLLYLLDWFEGSSDYLEFLRERNYIDKEHYNEYSKVIETNFGQQMSGELVVKTEFARSETKKEQLAAEVAADEEFVLEKQITVPATEEDERFAKYWFDELKPLIRKMVEFLQTEKPELSKGQIMNTIKDRMFTRQIRSELDAIKGVIDDFGLFLPNPLLKEYRHRKQQTAYENKPGIREERMARKKARRRMSKESPH
jgi:hypothetical protein